MHFNIPRFRNGVFDIVVIGIDLWKDDKAGDENESC